MPVRLLLLLNQINNMWQTRGLLWAFLFTLLSFSALAENTLPVKVRIQAAAQKLNYSGTFVYQQSNQIRTSRITHLLSGKNEVEKLEILDGRPREYIRNNDDIACYVPEAKTVLIEKRITRDIFPAILASNLTDLVGYYGVRIGGTARVAGHDCQEVILEPKDKLRYGYKMWADKATGLLLRAQTLNAKNEVVEQISFTQIEIGHIDPARVKPSFANTSGWHVEYAVMTPVNLSNWSVTVPPGFKKIQEVKRLISDTQNPTASTPSSGASQPTAQREISQIVFSDGLAAISVFIEPDSKGRSESFVQQGAMNIVGRRQGDYWLTIIGEVPALTIRQVSNSIELKSK